MRPGDGGPQPGFSFPPSLPPHELAETGNAFLAPAERRSALALSRCLRAVEQGWRGGEASAAALVRRGLETLTQPGVTPEYVALVDERLQPVERVTAATVVVVAARVGKTRLIDNVVLGDGVAGDVAVRS